MPVDSSITIYDDGPTAVPVLTLDKNGISDRSSRYHSAWQNVSWPLLAASLSSYIWTCKEGIWQVQDVEAVVTVTGGSSATVDLLVCSGVTAPASGTSQLTAVLDIQETAPFRARGTLITTPTKLVRGDSLAVVFGGTLTGLVGLMSVQVKRVS